MATRMAVLGLAFDHLYALVAVSSARSDNGASLGVSRSIGYTDNGVSLNDSGHGLVELRHLCLTAAVWRASGQGSQVTVNGYEGSSNLRGNPVRNARSGGGATSSLSGQRPALAGVQRLMRGCADMPARGCSASAALRCFHTDPEVRAPDAAKSRSTQDSVRP